MKFILLTYALLFSAFLEANIVILERSSVFTFEHVERDGVEYLLKDEAHRILEEDENGIAKESFSSERFSMVSGLESVYLDRGYSISAENGAFESSTSIITFSFESEVILSQRDSVRFMGDGRLSLYTTGFALGDEFSTTWKLWDLTNNQLVWEYIPNANEGVEEYIDFNIYTRGNAQELIFNQELDQVEMLFESETRYEGVVQTLHLLSQDLKIIAPTIVPEASTFTFLISFLLTFIVRRRFSIR